MNISIATYTYVLSSICSSIQLTSNIIKNFVNPQFSYISINKLRQGHPKSITSLLFLFNQSLFTIYNVSGLIISYSRGYVIYRSIEPCPLDRFLQFLEIVYESIEKSILFSTLVLFLPVLKLITKSYTEYSHTKKELKYGLTYIIIRTFVYPLTYIILYKYPMLSLFMIEIMNISESIILICIFIIVHTNINNHFTFINPQCERTKELMKNLYSRFTFVSRLCITQLMLEIFYKTCIIFFTMNNVKAFYRNFIDWAFLFRLVSFSMQSYALSKLCDEDEKRSPENIFWTPSYNEDYIFFEPYEDKKNVDKMGSVYGQNYFQHNGVKKHVFRAIK